MLDKTGPKITPTNIPADLRVKTPAPAVATSSVKMPEGLQAALGTESTIKVKTPQQQQEEKFIGLLKQKFPLYAGNLNNVHTLDQLKALGNLPENIKTLVNNPSFDVNNYNSVADLDTTTNNPANPTKTGSGAPAATLPSMQLPATPTIPSMNGETQMPDMNAVQDTLLNKGYENGNILQPGANPKEQSDNLAKLIDEKKAAKLEVEKGFDHRINEEGTECINEYMKQRKDVLVENANKDLQALKKTELKTVYDTFGDPEKDYAKESGNIEKVANLKNFDEASKLINADNGLKIGDKDLVSDLSARLNLANGMEDLCKIEIRKLSAEKGVIRQIPGDNTFASKVAAAQAKIDAVVKKGEEIKAQKAKIAEAMDKKKTDRQKEIDAIFAKETNPKIKERIEKRNKDIENIPKEAEVIDAQAAIKSGDVEKVKFDPKNIKEASLLTRHIDEMIKLKGEKALALKNTDGVINEFESKKAGLDAIKDDPKAKAPQSVKASTNFGDKFGTITQVLTGLAGLALVFKSMQVASNANNAGNTGLLGGPALPGQSNVDPKKYQVNLDANGSMRNAVMGQAISTKNVAFSGGAAANLSAAKSNVFPSQPNAT